jgi:hypothetical protein
MDDDIRMHGHASALTDAQEGKKPARSRQTYM